MNIETKKIVKCNNINKHKNRKECREEIKVFKKILSWITGEGKQEDKNSKPDYKTEQTVKDVELELEDNKESIKDSIKEEGLELNEGQDIKNTNTNKDSKVSSTQYKPTGKVDIKETESNTAIEVSVSKVDEDIKPTTKEVKLEDNKESSQTKEDLKVNSKVETEVKAKVNTEDKIKDKPVKNIVQEVEEILNKVPRARGFKTRNHLVINGERQVYLECGCGGIAQLSDDKDIATCNRCNTESQVSTLEESK